VECEFDDAGIVDQETELLTHPLVRESTLCTRDVLYGVRTEAMHLHHNVQENETSQYVDIMSL